MEALKIDLIKPALVALCIFFAVMWLTRGCQDKPKTLPSDGTEWRHRVLTLEAQIHERDSLIQEIREKRHIDSLEHSRAVSGLKMREMSLVRKLKEANADIQVIADSLPKVARYIELADSTIAVKDSLYTQEVNHGISTEALYKSEIAQMGARHMHQEKISSILEMRVMELQDQNSKIARKLQRKQNWNTFWKGLAVGTAAAATVVIITSQ